MVSKQTHHHMVGFRSLLDFRRQSRLYSKRSFGEGSKITDTNRIAYNIEWSPDYNFVFKSPEGEIHIDKTPWSLPFHLEIERKLLKKSLSDDDIATGLQRFIVHFISCIEHLLLEIDVMGFRLDGRPILFRDQSSDNWRQLAYEKQAIAVEEIFEEYALLGESGIYDAVCSEAGDLRPLNLTWQLLIDSIASFEAGRYRGAVIYACSAIEVEVTPIVRNWLSANTLTKPKDIIENALIEVGNPLKFEVFFESLKADALDIYSRAQQGRLLVGLKWLNRLRNHIVHKGQDANPEEAKRAIRIVGLLLRALWIHERRQFFKKKLKIDLFSGSVSKMRRLDI